MSSCCPAIQDAYEKASIAFSIESATLPSSCENQVYIKPTDAQIQETICNKASAPLQSALKAIKQGNVADEIPSVCQANGKKMKCTEANIKTTLETIKTLQDKIDAAQCEMNTNLIRKRELEGILAACAVQLEQRNKACMINENDCGKCALLLQQPTTSSSSCSVKTVCKKKKSSKYSKKKKKSSKGKKKKKKSSSSSTAFSSLSTPSGFSSYDSSYYSNPYGDSTYFG